MNRPIKFRIWNGEKMEYNVVSGALGAFYALIDKNDTACLSPTTKYPPDTPLMQYTGLTDKNGKEIYEGDIIHLKFGELNANLVVKWDKYMGLEYHNGGWTSLVHVGTHGEVIGNIFENPELPN
jgi:uncharacterized phage protein (TIGR01671 family)